MRDQISSLENHNDLFDMLEGLETLARPQAESEPEAAAAYALATWLLLRRHKWWAQVAADLYETLSPAVTLGLSLVPTIAPDASLRRFRVRWLWFTFYATRPSA